MQPNIRQTNKKEVIPVPINSYKDDEQTVEASKLATLKRLLAYLFHYKSAFYCSLWHSALWYLC